MNALHNFQAFSAAHAFAIAIAYMVLTILMPLLLRIAFPNLNRTANQFQDAMHVNRPAVLIVCSGISFIAGWFLPALSLFSMLACVVITLAAIPFISKLEKILA